MKAIVGTQYGSPDMLQIQEVPKPVPKDNEVLVKVYAASVNAGDWRLVRGKPFVMRLMGYGLLRPTYSIPGTDIAGSGWSQGYPISTRRRGVRGYGRVWFWWFCRVCVCQ